MPPQYTSTNNSLFATLAAIESGTLGGYRAVNGNALGAYQMILSQSLSRIGAVVPGPNATWVWTGKFGSSQQEFLSTPSLQDAAALAYMNSLASSIPADVSAKFGTIIGVRVHLLRHGIH